MTSYLITGATGNLGGRIAERLRAAEPTATVAALARHGASAAPLERRGLRVVRGDYDDAAGLAAAFTGVDRLVLVSSPVLDPAIRARQHLAVIDRAVGAGVGHVIYTSALGAEHDPGHRTTEQALADALPHTILRNGLYSEPFARRALDEAVRTGTITSSTEGCPVRTVSVDDLAEAACLAAVEASPRSATWSLNGTPWTYDELARHLGARLGRPVAHRAASDAEVGPFGQLHALFRHGLLAQGADELAGRLGRAPRSIEAVVDGLDAEPRGA